jgi:hypothetical protein
VAWKFFKRRSYMPKLTLCSPYRQTHEYIYVHRYIKTKYIYTYIHIHT